MCSITVTVNCSEQDSGTDSPDPSELIRLRRNFSLSKSPEGGCSYCYAVFCQAQEKWHLGRPPSPAARGPISPEQRRGPVEIQPPRDSRARRLSRAIKRRCARPLFPPRRREAAGGLAREARDRGERRGGVARSILRALPGAFFARCPEPSSSLPRGEREGVRGRERGRGGAGGARRRSFRVAAVFHLGALEAHPAVSRSDMA
jgi:hypothetical protein